MRRTKRRQLLSAGTVTTTLDTVEDLLLKFFPLLLLLREVFGLGPSRVVAANVAKNFTVLGVPKVCIQAARGGKKGRMVPTLFYLTLVQYYDLVCVDNG